METETNYGVNKVTLADLYELKYGDEATLDLGTFTVTVQKRSGDFMVWLNGNKGDWGCHKYLDHAVGYMVLTHYSRLVSEVQS